MKKVLSVLLVLVAVMSMTAFAAETYTPGGDGTYSIGYTEGINGSYYALLVVEGVYEEGATPTISEDTVLYIDQATADANGDVTFDGWIPKNEEPATVYLGGTGLETPVLLGYLGSNTFVVSGTVTTDSGTTYEATVTLTDAENNVFTATSVSGAYTVEVPEGTYTMTISVNNHLGYTKSSLDVSSDIEYKSVELLGGDIDGNGTITGVDLGDLLTNYGKNDENYDISGDTTVSGIDLGTLLTNYGKSSVQE